MMQTLSVLISSKLASSPLAATGQSAAAAPSPAGWLGVDWGSILLVFVAGMAVTVVITVSYAFGTRLLAVGAPDVVVPAGSEPDSPDAVQPPRTTQRPVVATIGAWLCFAVGIVAAAYGLYLVIPAFHS
ncbi:hypothetical protein GCM10027568_25050 [Humibacter soli]